MRAPGRFTAGQGDAGAPISFSTGPILFLNFEIIFVVKWDTITLSVLDPLLYLYNYMQVCAWQLL
jgi:hypothetical protein